MRLRQSTFFYVVLALKAGDHLVDGFISCTNRSSKVAFSLRSTRPAPASMRMSESTVDIDPFEGPKNMDEPVQAISDYSSHTMELQAEPLDTLKVKDPVGALLEESRVLDWDSIINIGIVVCICMAVLAKVSTVDAGFMRGWTLEERALRVPIDIWHSYEAILQNAPIRTKAVTSATVYTIGDVVAQSTEGTSIGQLDRLRILRSMLAGLIGHGPLSHLWYNVSDELFNNILHWTAWWSFMPKIVLDQTTWGPIWNNTYILLLGLMKKESLETIWKEIQMTTVPLVVSGLKLWPLAHCITYGLIPVENRLLWVDLVEIVWVTILATAASGASVKTQEDET